MAAEYRRMIELYLRKRDEIEVAKNENVNKNLSPENQIRFANDIHFDELLRMEQEFIEILNKYREEKPRYEAAVYDYINGQKRTVKHIADNYSLSYSSLQKEIAVYKHLQEKYQYNRTVTVGKFSFTFQEEEWLLDLLKNLTVDKVSLPCSCKACILERVSALAYNYAKNNKKQYPIDWERNKRADIMWLQEFELRYSIEISRLCIKSCTLPKEP